MDYKVGDKVIYHEPDSGHHHPSTVISVQCPPGNVIIQIDNADEPFGMVPTSTIEPA